MKLISSGRKQIRGGLKLEVGGGGLTVKGQEGVMEMLRILMVVAVTWVQPLSKSIERYT